MINSDSGFRLAIGKQGSGKTLFITKLMVDSFKGRKIFSNYTLFGIDYERVTLNPEIKESTLNARGEMVPVIKILDKLDEDPDYFNGSILLLDEIHLDLDSYDFFKKNNRRMQTFFSQLRKRNILLLGTTQYIMNVDIRIRRQCMNIFEMSHAKEHIFEVITHEIDGYYTTEVSRYFINLSEYYDYYDTTEIIA